VDVLLKCLDLLCQLVLFLDDISELVLAFYDIIGHPPSSSFLLLLNGAVTRSLSRYSLGCGERRKGE
jgi:hypothetical protein